VQDYVECCLVCMSCGLVGDRIGFWYDINTTTYNPEEDDNGDYLVAGTEIARLANRPSEYKREYHDNERWAQLLGTGPACPDFMVDAARKYFYRDTSFLNDGYEWLFHPGRQRKRIKKHASKINSVTIRKFFRSVGMTRFAERWIDVRNRIMDSYGYTVIVRFPSSKEINVMRQLFHMASSKFDSTYYRGGKRRTNKDNLVRSERSLARHNMPNYNYVKHQLHWMLGIRKQCMVHYYWPLLKTPKVLDKLDEMWKGLTAELGWPYADKSVIADPHYSYDAISLAVALQDGTNENHPRRLPSFLPLSSRESSVS